MRRTVRNGVNLHEESGSEQGCEPYGGDHSAAIDHSVGNSRRRIGFLLGSCLSSPLALANSKHNTWLAVQPGEIAWYDQRNQLARHLRYTSLAFS